MTTDLRLAVTQQVYGDSAVKVPCLNPEHQDDTASMAVYPSNIHCFGCGFHVANTEKALALLLGVTQAEAREIAPTLAARTPTQAKPGIDAREHPMANGLADLYYSNLYDKRKHRLEWLYARGLDDSGIARGRLGHNGTAFVVPVFDGAGRLLTLRFRRDDFYAGQGEQEHGPKYRGTKGRNGLFLYGEAWLTAQQGDWCVVTEGELDALRLWQDGVPAVSATNGAGQSHRVPLLLRELCPSYRTLMVATDTDGAGGLAASRVCEAAKKLGYRVVRLSWLDKAKDVTEYLQQGGTFKEMLRREYCPFDGERWERTAGTTQAA